MTKRPDIRLALDVRSHEKIVVFADPQSDFRYPPEWLRCNPDQSPVIDGDTVVIVDRVELDRRVLAQVLTQYPRILGIAIADLDHEKQARRSLRALYPWSEVWELATDFGKVLATVTGGRTGCDMRSYAA